MPSESHSARGNLRLYLKDVPTGKERQPEDFEEVQTVGVLRKVEAGGQEAESAGRPRTPSPSTAITLRKTGK